VYCAVSLDHLVGAAEQHGWHVETDRLGGIQVKTPQADNTQAEFQARLTNPNNGTTTGPPGVGASGEQAALEAARAQRDDYLKNAWKTPSPGYDNVDRHPTSGMFVKKGSAR
jgi:hypothetical protein